jgi:uncharacterized protein YdhG (YjbR/CyaY superfamily)
LRYHPLVKKHINAHQGKSKLTLIKVRRMILQSLPNIEETFTYAMPTYRMKQNIMHFRGYAHHLGIYPGPVGVKFLKTLDQQLVLTKGTWKLSWNTPFPYGIFQTLLHFLKEHYHI